MRVLVTGCAGFIGSHLSERLLELGHDVVGVDCFTDYYDRSQKDANLSGCGNRRRFQLIEADLAVDELEPIVAGVDLVYHQAAQAGVRASWGTSFESYARNNILATQRLLEALKERPLKKFIFASSSSVYGDAEGYPTSESALPRPVSPYGVTKLSAEQLVYLYWRNFGLPTVSLRYFTVYGPRQRPDMGFHRFIQRALHGEPISVYGDGEQTRDFTFVDDIVNANILAGKSDIAGQVFNVGGAHRVSVNQVLAIIGELTERPIQVQHTSQQKGDVHHTSADIRLAYSALGYTPKVDLRSGLAQQVKWQIGMLAGTSREPALSTAR